MKFILATLSIGILSLFGDLFMQWWCIAPIAFIVSFFLVQTPFKAFLSGFAAIFLLWVLQSYWISLGNHHILAHKISMLIIKMDRPIILILVTGIVGGLVAGFASITASYYKNNSATKSV